LNGSFLALFSSSFVAGDGARPMPGRRAGTNPMADCRLEQRVKNLDRAQMVGCSGVTIYQYRCSLPLLEALTAWQPRLESAEKAA